MTRLLPLQNGEDSHRHPYNQVRYSKLSAESTRELVIHICGSTIEGVEVGDGLGISEDDLHGAWQGSDEGISDTDADEAEEDMPVAYHSGRESRNVHGGWMERLPCGPLITRNGAMER